MAAFVVSLRRDKTIGIGLFIDFTQNIFSWHPNLRNHVASLLPVPAQV